MIKAILFDMDGVLVDSQKAWFIIFSKTLDFFEKKTITREEFDKEVWAKNFNETAKRYFNVSLERIRDKYSELYPIFKENLKPFPDTATALKHLKKRFRLALVTNTHTQHAERLLHDLSLDNYFEYIIGADQVKNGKPEPDIILKTLKDMKLKKEDAMYVGDTIWDKIAANKSGVRFIGYKIDGDKKIDSLTELS